MDTPEISTNISFLRTFPIHFIAAFISAEQICSFLLWLKHSAFNADAAHLWLLCQGCLQMTSSTWWQRAIAEMMLKGSWLHCNLPTAFHYRAGRRVVIQNPSAKGTSPPTISSTQSHFKYGCTSLSWSIIPVGHGQREKQHWPLPWSDYHTGAKKCPPQMAGEGAELFGVGYWAFPTPSHWGMVGWPTGPSPWSAWSPNCIGCIGLMPPSDATSICSITGVPQHSPLIGDLRCK